MGEERRVWAAGKGGLGLGTRTSKGKELGLETWGISVMTGHVTQQPFPYTQREAGTCGDLQLNTPHASHLMPRDRFAPGVLKGPQHSSCSLFPVTSLLRARPGQGKITMSLSPSRAYQTGLAPLRVTISIFALCGKPC